MPDFDAEEVYAVTNSDQDFSIERNGTGGNATYE
jgi:hypothetical protein